ncbi:hypothetical protein FS749_002851 [Ceratobasidium sp. UAMH 11750]|nr:hypothetical protein FS749_002851 [Ceratobasidium sp. UAMH 11750]
MHLQHTKVAHKDVEDLTYAGSPPPAQQYHSNPNQPSTSHLALSHVQSHNPLTTPDEIAFFDRVPTAGGSYYTPKV